MPPSEAGEGRPGVDLLLTRQVAEEKDVHPTTVERWIKKGLPAVVASPEQLGQLVAGKFLMRVPPHGVVYLISKSDLALIPQISAYPKDTKRKRKQPGATTGKPG